MGRHVPPCWRDPTIMAIDARRDGFELFLVWLSLPGFWGHPGCQSGVFHGRLGLPEGHSPRGKTATIGARPLGASAPGTDPSATFAEDGLSRSRWNPDRSGQQFLPSVRDNIATGARIRVRRDDGLFVQAVSWIGEFKDFRCHFADVESPGASGHGEASTLNQRSRGTASTGPFVTRTARVGTRLS